MLNKKALATLLAMLALSLLLVGPVLAQDTGVLQGDYDAPPPPDMWDGGLTTADNLDNAWDPFPDDDMGYPDVPDVCEGDWNEPIEFEIDLGGAPSGDMNLWLAVCDVDPDQEYDEVWLNNNWYLGHLPFTEDGECAIVLFEDIPRGWLQQHNLIQVFVDDTWCMGLAWGLLGDPVEFVPEPGSIILLGSGLMGLAGYAGLRLRKK
jgi:hypothetical protein